MQHEIVEIDMPPMPLVLIDNPDTDDLAYLFLQIHHHARHRFIFNTRGPVHHGSRVLPNDFHAGFRIGSTSQQKTPPRVSHHKWSTG